MLLNICKKSIDELSNDEIIFITKRASFLELSFLLIFNYDFLKLIDLSKKYDRELTGGILISFFYDDVKDKFFIPYYDQLKNMGINSIEEFFVENLYATDEFRSFLEDIGFFSYLDKVYDNKSYDKDRIIQFNQKKYLDLISTEMICDFFEFDVLDLSIISDEKLFAVVDKLSFLKFDRNLMRTDINLNEILDLSKSSHFLFNKFISDERFFNKFLDVVDNKNMWLFDNVINYVNPSFLNDDFVYSILDSKKFNYNFSFASPNFLVDNYDYVEFSIYHRNRDVVNYISEDMMNRLIDKHNDIYSYLVSKKYLLSKKSPNFLIDNPNFLFEYFVNGIYSKIYSGSAKEFFDLFNKKSLYAALFNMLNDGHIFGIGKIINIFDFFDDSFLSSYKNKIGELFSNLFIGNQIDLNSISCKDSINYLLSFCNRTNFSNLLLEEKMSYALFNYYVESFMKKSEDDYFENNIFYDENLKNRFFSNYEYVKKYLLICLDKNIKIVDSIPSNLFLRDYIDLSLSRGYVVTKNSPDLFFNDVKLLINLVFEKNEAAIDRYFSKIDHKNYTLYGLKLRLKECEYNEIFSSFLDYINKISGKKDDDRKFKNLDEVFSLNKKLEDFFYDLLRYKVAGFDVKYERLKSKFICLLKVTRIMGMNIDFDVFEEMNIDLISHFKTSMYSKISNLDVFKNNGKAIVGAINIFGLFDDDRKSANKRFDVLKSMIYDSNIMLTFDEYNKFVSRNEEFKQYFVLKKSFSHFIDGDIPVVLKKYHEYFCEIIDYKKFLFLKKLIPSGRVNGELTRFLNHECIRGEDFYFALNKSKLKEFYEKVYPSFIFENIYGFLNRNSVNVLFSDYNRAYNEEFYNFFVNNFYLVVNDYVNQSRFGSIGKNYSLIKEKSSFSNFTYDFAISFFDKVIFDNTYEGNESLIEFFASAGVRGNEAFSYYQDLYEKAKNIKYTNIPNYYQEFDYTRNNKKYKLRARRLLRNDPLSLVVGEANYTNCCQNCSSKGKSCVEHALLKGAIFVTEVFLDDKWQLLTQSWDWVNGSLYCHDNIEGSSLFKSKYYYEPMIADIYLKHAEYILNYSKRKIYEYIESNHLSVEQEKNALDNIIKIVTVGTGHNDLSVSSYFNKRLSSSIGPFDYDGYRDSNNQIIISGDESNLAIDVDDLNLYRERRSVNIEKYLNISSLTLMKMDAIENEKSVDNKIVLKGSDELGYNLHIDSKLDNLYVVSGEDWFFVYHIGNDIEILNITVGNPRFLDELDNQRNELEMYLNNILGEDKMINVYDIVSKIYDKGKTYVKKKYL